MNAFERFNDWVRQSLMLKLVAVGILILILLIPTSMVSSLIQERKYSSESVINEVSGAWSDAQTIAGPILTIPYKEYYTDEKGAVFNNTKYAHFLPDSLIISGNIQTSTRYRSIYQVVVYTSNLNVRGAFSTPNFESWKIEPTNVLWDEAYLSVGISDMRGIQRAVNMRWQDTILAFSPGINVAMSTQQEKQYDSYNQKQVKFGGMSAYLDLTSRTNALDFSFDLALNGSRNIYFTPVGKQTEVTITSDWASPSFQGAFLPDSNRVTDGGFYAQWNVLHLNRNYPQQTLESGYDFNDSHFGLDLLIPADYYQKSERSAKYGILFIALTFLIFFFVEVLNNKRIHPIQYILVGLGLILFFTLLLAFSEHIGFEWSYLISSAATIALIGVYIANIFKATSLTWITIMILAMLYGFIYLLLQLEDYALLLGSIGLFVILSIVMIYTRKIDWYKVRN